MHEAVILVAKYFIVLSALLVLWVFFELPAAKKKEFIVVGVIGAIITVLLAKIGSHLYYDTRPFVVGHFMPYIVQGADNGFPSDHTLLAGFCTFLGFRYAPKISWALLFVALLIGLARVKAGVHHSIDILGGFAFSFVGVWLSGLLVDVFLERKPPYKAKTSHN